jgi:hypothetical protein
MACRFDVKHAPVAVVLEDSSPTAREVLAGLNGIGLHPPHLCHDDG